MMVLLWWVVGLTALFQPVDGITARFEPETFTPLTGQPFVMRLVVEVPDGIQLEDWLVLTAGEMWGEFEVRAVGERTQQLWEDGTTRYEQAYTLVVWFPRDVVTPETFLTYSRGGDDVRRIPVRSTWISVPGVVDPLSPVLRPARPIRSSGVGWLLPVVGVGAVSLLMVGWWKRRRRVVEGIAAASDPMAQAARVMRGLCDGRGHESQTPQERLRYGIRVLLILKAEGQLPDTVDGVLHGGEELLYSGQPIHDEAVREWACEALMALQMGMWRDE